MSAQLSFGPPLATFERITLDELNGCLVAWEHKMGELHRPFACECYGLRHNGQIVGVIATAGLISERVGGLTRVEAIEVARLCAARTNLCRVVLRLWREMVFPTMSYRYAVSYQDEGLHTGHTYRFDGWHAIARSRSGPDRRTGRQGRNKTIWAWEKVS